MKLKPIILITLFTISAIFYYNITDSTVQRQTFQVTRIIDGDTLEIETGHKLRLKGINTPEKNMPFHNKAKQFLENTLAPFDAEGYPIGESIQIESHGADKYERILAHIFLNNQHINEQILKQGLATLYYYDPDSHYKKLKQAEEFARLNQKGLWKKSPNANCIQLIELKTDDPEKLTLQNNCNKILNITYKDDATHIYQTTIQPNSQHTQNFSHIWNTDGDSLYISDKQGLLIFHRY